jgi:hypothetical protein
MAEREHEDDRDDRLGCISLSPSAHRRFLGGHEEFRSLFDAKSAARRSRLAGDQCSLAL